MGAEDKLLQSVLNIVDILEDPDTDPCDFLQRVLSIESLKYTSDKIFKGAEILVTSGDPCVWIDTYKDVVYGTWGDYHFSRQYEDVCGLNDYLEENYA
jgi:hypothetical protein